MEGGLGNQLFQYALYRQLRFMGRTVKMDVTTEYGREHDRQQMLWALLYLRIYQNCESFIETWLIIIIKHRQWGINLFINAEI